MPDQLCQPRPLPAATRCGLGGACTMRVDRKREHERCASDCLPNEMCRAAAAHGEHPNLNLPPPPPQRSP
eukprot:3097426-Prymnesium_polylepis.2